MRNDPDPRQAVPPNARADKSADSKERRRQLRGLLILAFAALAFLLWRAHPALIFHPNWWRP